MFTTNNLTLQNALTSEGCSSEDMSKDIGCTPRFTENTREEAATRDDHVRTL